MKHSPSFLTTLCGTEKPIIGMLHAPPLPGSPRWGRSWQAVEDTIIADARLLEEAGVHALMLENFGDAPFFPDRVPAHTVASLTALAKAVRLSVKLPLGINMLRNDGASALAVAQAVGAAFIRVNVLCGARVTDQGVIQGIAHDLLRLRRDLEATDIRILADVDVKHSAPLAERPLDQEVADVVGRGGADAVIVSGSGTGRKVEVADLEVVKEAAMGRPVLVGSGASPESLPGLLSVADALIVGTTLKVDGVPTNPVSAERAAAFMRGWRELTSR